MVHPLLKQSHGKQPKVVQDDVFPEGIRCLTYAAEARQVLVGTASGFLIKLHRDGVQDQRVRGFDHLNHLAWSHDGRFGAAVTRDKRLTIFDRHLRPKWHVTMTGKINCIAMSPFGSHIATGTEARRIHVVTTDKKELVEIETPQAINHIQFLQDSAAFIAAAEFGHLCKHSIDGQLEFEERIMNNVGGLAITANGKRILMAAFNHGVQVMDAEANSMGSFQIDGLPAKIICSMAKRRIVVTTLESRLYVLNFEGDLQWACDLAVDPVHVMTMDHSGTHLWIATVSGRLLQLKW
ncbi:MAG: WD40 repeat domain-containing protein [Fuerstiella sp.]